MKFTNPRTPAGVTLDFKREVEKLIDTAGENRWGHRDVTAILVAYRHGLRASEVVSLRWDDIDLCRRQAFTCGRCAGSSVKLQPAPTCLSPSALAPLSVAGYQRMVRKGR